MRIKKDERHFLISIFSLGETSRSSSILSISANILDLILTLGMGTTSVKISLPQKIHFGPPRCVFISTPVWFKTSCFIKWSCDIHSHPFNILKLIYWRNNHTHHWIPYCGSQTYQGKPYIFTVCLCIWLYIFLQHTFYLQHFHHFWNILHPTSSPKIIHSGWVM